MRRSKIYIIVENFGSFYAEASSTRIRDMAYRNKKDAEKELLEEGWVKGSSLEGNVVYDSAKLLNGTKIYDYWTAEIKEIEVRR